MRKVMIAGNWKMNKTVAGSLNFLDGLKNKEDENTRVVLCPPFLSLQALKEKAEGVEICAQNMHFEENGAFTGEVSASMLKEIGITMTLLGHSERREYFGETDEVVRKKVNKAMEEGMEIILCVGEVLEEREGNRHEEVVKQQLLENLKDVKEEQLKNITIAYEPVWAIGTGKTASAEDAEEMCGFIRGVIKENFSEDASEQILILYGGSVKPENIKELLGMDNIDGALVGGASLKPESFDQLVRP